MTYKKLLFKSLLTLCALAFVGKFLFDMSQEGLISIESAFITFVFLQRFAILGFDLEFADLLAKEN